MGRFGSDKVELGAGIKVTRSPWCTTPSAPPAGLGSFGGRLLLSHLPNALCVVLSVWAAARLHRPPFRCVTVRHLTVALSVPVAAQVLDVAVQWRHLTAEGVLMSHAVPALGCVAGWAADRLQEGD
ncbi:hypothetical protein AB0K02_17615 [Streptomyces sp. NPDC049597]|uniref:hypothetical protein n=1 Tax=Streptomyces sp. NPDC049597 TaxID=3155276 RepID=UPI00341B6212